MTRRPGYDIYGQPTKVDPRDYPDPLRPPEPEPPKADRRGDWGCSVFALSLLLAVVVAGCSVAAGNESGAAMMTTPPYVSEPEAPALRRLTVYTSPAAVPSPSPLPITGTAADVSFSGSLWWAKPSYGPRYLAIRWPRGTIATLCGSADCVTRASTDYGPVLSLWEKGRLADMSAADFEKVCGMSAAQRILHGHCQGTLLIVKRGRIVLPQTDLEEGP